MIGKLLQKIQTGGMAPEQLMMLAFLAGNGLDPYSRSMERLTPKPPAAGKGGAAVRSAAAGGAPGAGVTPQMLQQLIAMSGRGPGVPSTAPAVPPGLLR